jgi:triosephosphate isomerase
MKIFLVGNWKMNPDTLAKAKKLFDGIEKELRKTPEVFKKEEIILCPPFLYLSEIKNLILKSQLKIHLGAQNCFFEEKGAFTGEISPKMLKSLGVKYVILGHSERRKNFAENDEIINKKILAVLKEKLVPILCVGETEKERKSQKTLSVLKNQLKKGLKNVSQIEKMILAYEPVWAIGTKNPCEPESAKKVLLFLRKFLKKIPILYGGSVNSKNAKDYIKVGFNGLLVGGASLNTKEFTKIAREISKI